MTDREKKKCYRGLFIVNFLVCLGLGIVDPFFPVYATTHGATGFHLAILFSGYAAAKALFSPLMGWLSDQRGRRNLLIAGLFSYALISLGYLFFPDPFSLILLRFLQGMAAALVRPLSLAIVGDIAPARREGTVMGAFDISFYAAFAIGPIVGGIIKDAVGFSGIFLSLFCLALLAMAALMLFMKGPGQLDGKERTTGRMDIRSFKKSKMLVALCGFIFTRTFGIVLFSMFLPIFMHEELKLKGVEIGVIMGAATIVTALLLGPMGYLSDRVRKDRLVVIGGAGAALLTCCLPLAGTFHQLLVLSVGIGIASVLSLPASTALLVEEGNRLGMGMTMGVFNGAMNLGAVLAPLIAGAAFGLVGIKALFYGAGLIGLVGTCFYFAYTAKPRAPHRKVFNGASVPLDGAGPLVTESSICREG
ncbi:MAG: MFS transporter [Deltaproteobacteria bacterium]|nr:MFS transporter [Deltaproteobacteria bacterium]